METINKNFDELLSDVQKAFEAREKGIIGLGHASGSGEKAITAYFKAQGVEIDSNNQVVKNIASGDKEVTAENLQALLDNIGHQTKDQAARQQEEAKLEPSNMNTVAIYTNHMENLRKAEKRAKAGSTNLPSGEPIALTQDGDFEKADAQNLIIRAYNECVDNNKMDADTFVNTLFPIDLENGKNLPRNEAKEVFAALQSQYGNNKIKDNLDKVEKDPGNWDKIKDFITKCLKLDVLFGINTNVDDKAKYKANKMEPKSLLDHAQKNIGMNNTL